MVHLRILAPWISANEAHNCKDLTVPVCLQPRPEAVWKGQNERYLQFLRAFPVKGPIGSLYLHPYTRLVHWDMTKLRSSHCLPKLNGALSLREFHGAFSPQTSSKFLVRSGPSAAKQALYALSSLQAMPDQSPESHPFPQCGNGEYSCNTSFFQGFLCLWGHIIKSGNYSIYFISRKSLSSPQNSIIIWGNQLQPRPTFWLSDLMSTYWRNCYRFYSSSLS